jgi:hypothetical protein
MLTEQMGFKEVVTRALHSMSSLTQIKEDIMESQVENSFNKEWQNRNYKSCEPLHRKCEIRGKKLLGAWQPHMILIFNMIERNCIFL